MNVAASELIEKFISGTKEVTRFFNTLVVHLLSHLPEQVMMRGSLDETSCFKYENALKAVAKLYKPNRHHLKSVANKLQKKNIIETNGAAKNKELSINLPKQEINFPGFTLKLRLRDCYFGSKGDIYMLKNIPTRSYVEAHRFQIKESSFYCVLPDSNRFESSNAGVYRISKPELRTSIIRIKDIDTKYVVHVEDNNNHEQEPTLFAYKLL